MTLGTAATIDTIAVKLLEHGMKVVESVSANEVQFCFMPETMDAVFIMRRMQEEYHANGEKFFMCFVDLEKAFDRVPSKVWNGQ